MTLPPNRTDLALWLEKVQSMVDSYFAANYPTQGVILSLMVGPKYARVVRTDKGNSPSRSVYGFVDLSNGNLLKADGWKRPALNFPRGNMMGADPLMGCGPHSIQ